MRSLPVFVVLLALVACGFGQGWFGQGVVNRPNGDTADCVQTVATDQTGHSWVAWNANPGDTTLFCYPGFDFKVLSALVTNFHLPRSSLLMLVAAFAGLDLMRRAYAVAVEEGYRFYSYGDAMLII